MKMTEMISAELIFAKEWIVRRLTAPLLSSGSSEMYSDTRGTLSGELTDMKRREIIRMRKEMPPKSSRTPNAGAPNSRLLRLKHIFASGRRNALSCLLTCIGVVFLSGSIAAQKSGKPARSDNENLSGQAVKSAASTTNFDLSPRKTDDQTAVSPIYPINSKNCRHRDAKASEGEEFYRECPGYGDYLLRATGFDYRINYGIISKKTSESFELMLFPLEEGAAAKYVRADLYDEKLAETIEWRLDERGTPFAIIVRAAFYKNTGSAKTFDHPKNKIAEFIFLRGLAGFEDLKEDLPTTGTAFNPLEQARVIAAEFLARRRNK